MSKLKYFSYINEISWISNAIYIGGSGEKGGGVSAIKWELGDVKIARCYVSNTRKYKKNKVNYKVGSYSLHHILI